MLCILWKMNKQLYLAHRGHWHDECIENTIPAFNKTYKNLSNKCHGFECDLRQINKKDPTSWIVFHDETTSRFCNANQELRPQILLESKGIKSNLPSLNDFKNWVSNLKKEIYINLEIKNGELNAIDYLINELANINKNTIFIYSSFNKKIVNHILKTNEKVGFLIRNEKDLESELIKHSFKQLYFIAIEYSACTNTIINIVSKLKVPLGVYFKTKESFSKNFQLVNKNLNFKIIFTES